MYLRRNLPSLLVSMNFSLDWIPLDEITCVNARKLYKCGRGRISSDAGRRALLPSSANRDVGNMRQFFAEYFKFIDEGERENPFRNLTYSLGQNALPFQQIRLKREN